MLTDRGFTLTATLSFLCVSSIGFVIDPLIAIRAADRYERKMTITLALLVYSAAFIAIALAPANIVVMAGGLVITFTIGLAVPLMYTLTAESFPNTIRARSIASSDGLGHLGGALAPFVILPAAGVRFGLGTGVMAASGLITAALVLMTRRHTGESLD